MVTPRIICLAVFVCVSVFTVQLLWSSSATQSPCLTVRAAEEPYDEMLQQLPEEVRITSMSTAGAWTGTSDLTTAITPTRQRMVYVITPTYPRQLQIPELTRLGQTLKLVPDVTWIVVEDANCTTEAVSKLLRRLRIPYEHLTAPMPEGFKNNTSKPRGVSNRNRGLEWLRANASAGVFYFADDDNTYDVRLFEEMRDTRRVSMWPVGLLSVGMATPVIRDGKVTGFYEGWNGNRKFPVDMAQFAVSVEFLIQRPQAKMPFTVGYEEDGFLKSLSPFEIEDIEVKASNCTEILVWHTQTKTPPALKPINSTLYAGTNLVELYDNLL